MRSRFQQPDRSFYDRIRRFCRNPGRQRSGY
jgi:hypothetical protein